MPSSRASDRKCDTNAPSRPMAWDCYNYGQIKQPDTEALMIAAEDWARRTGWTDPSR